MRRPLSITLIAFLFIALGAGGLLKDIIPLVTDYSRQLAKLEADGVKDLAPAWISRLLSVVGGVELFGGHNWARWLLAAWMVFHIVIGAMHSVSQFLTHVAIFVPIFYLLFRQSVNPFFYNRNAG